MTQAGALKRMAAAVALASALAFGPSAAAQASEADPLAVAQAALADARASLECRYAYTITETGWSRSLRSEVDTRVRQSRRFDPRRPIGQRWEIYSTSRSSQRDALRRMNSGDGFDPRSDLLTLLVEGEIYIEDLTLQRDLGDRWEFSFTPAGAAIVNPYGRPFLNAMTGTLTVSKDGRVLERILSVVDDGFDAGLGRVRSGTFTREYAEIAGGHTVVARSVNDMLISFRGQGVTTDTEQTISDVVAICDPTVVAAIAAEDETFSWTETQERADEIFRGGGTGSRLPPS